MGKPLEKMDFNAEYWKGEIRQLVNSSNDEKEKIALKCFERAMRPYLDNPETLRTMLGKIKMADTNN